MDYDPDSYTAEGRMSDMSIRSPHLVALVLLGLAGCRTADRGFTYTRRATVEWQSLAGTSTDVGVCRVVIVCTGDCRFCDEAAEQRASEDVTWLVIGTRANALDFADRHRLNQAAVLW